MKTKTKIKSIMDAVHAIIDFRSANPHCLSTTHTDINDSELLIIKGHFIDYQLTAFLMENGKWKVTIPTNPRVMIYKIKKKS